MARKAENGSKAKSGRTSRFSLRHLLASTNILAGASNANIPIPSTTIRAKDSFPSVHKKRNFSDSDQGLETIGSGSEASDVVTIDCYVEPQPLPNGLFECPLCYAPVEFFSEISCCHHRACSDCWKAYLRIQITESRINITCFQCSKLLHPNDIKSLCGAADLMLKYEEFMLRRVMALEPDARWCPAPDCGFAVIAAGCASCPRLLCERPNCNTAFCYHCKQLWHPNLTCDAARALRSAADALLVPSSSGSHKLSAETQTVTKEDIKPCPRCQILIVKMDDGSCNHMSCAVCGAEFCWLCMKEVSDLHYLSPSGCTFWGKKPWSRKKKLMWQLGTLIGAPVGIGLVAGIAVPAMVIGIPVWVGQKIHNKMKLSARHKRNVAVTGGVLAAIIISPVLAGLAVGLGVPVLLAYVYGVVPISLCRSGGCGMTTSSSGFRFEFDELDEYLREFREPSAVITHNGLTRQSTRSNDFGSSRGAPSIGEVSVVSSAGVGRVARGSSPDRESASIAALAGASLTGSVGSSSHPPSHNKLEIQADVTSTKRHSLSSETASVCLSMDDAAASTRGLAGSVLSYKVNIEDSKSEASCGQ
ncbi:unnamed protein product [Allacma fusca]|uniref:RBR-type E3 ubiquitin transferase n=1 Tax=Allacma fusca TaxID=39272 RepID=A0A8J2L7S0_9HEXA|nr:unnamed protein product [Allacma fusca]